MSLTLVAQDETKITEASGKGPDLLTHLPVSLCHIYGTMVTYCLNLLKHNFHFNSVHLDLLTGSFYNEKSLGALTLIIICVCGINLSPYWPIVCAKEREFITCLWDS